MATIEISRDGSTWVERLTEVDIILVNDGIVTVVMQTGLTRQFKGEDLVIKMV